jgi:hypothetical protein
MQSAASVKFSLARVPKILSFRSAASSREEPAFSRFGSRYTAM